VVICSVTGPRPAQEVHDGEGRPLPSGSRPGRPTAQPALAGPGVPHRLPIALFAGPILRHGRPMLTRIITGVVLAPLVVLLLFFGPPWAIAGVFTVASALCVYELLAMALPERRFERVAGVALALGLQVAMVLAPVTIVGVLVALLLVPALVVLARTEPIESALTRLLVLWGAFVYIVLPFSFGIELATRLGPWPIVLTLSVVWAGDTGAYFVGKAIGRHKLYPRVSPKKTIEGALGGLVASVLVAVAIVSIWWPVLDVGHAALVGLAGGAAAQLGDLLESLIKRSCGVKDSGAILPGHGGMLDRLDGVIVAFPVMYAMIF